MIQKIWKNFQTKSFPRTAASWSPGISSLVAIEVVVVDVVVVVVAGVVVVVVVVVVVSVVVVVGSNR